MNETWYKWDYVCPYCDANIEMTIKSNGESHDSSCPKCRSKMVLMSVLDATINSTTKKEEQPMEITEKDAMVAMWRQELELTYGNQITELQNKLDASQKQVENYRQLVSNANSQLGKIIDNMTEDYWYNPNTEASTILSDLCEILDHTPKKEISFTAVMHFNGRIEIDLADAEDFDLTEMLSDAYVDINHGDIVIDDYELYEADEC